MSLRRRLALSHFFVLVLFASLLISIVMYMSGGGMRSRVKASSQAISSLQSSGEALSRDSIREAVGRDEVLKETQVILKTPGRQREVLWGETYLDRPCALETVRLDSGPMAGSLLEIRTYSPNKGSFWNPLRDLLIAAAFAGLACIALSVIISNFISRPVALLASAVEQFEGRPLEERLETRGPREIIELADRFNSMAERLSKSMDELRVQKEEAERAEASRRQFLGEVSHNLRTPLAAILGWSQALIDDGSEGQELDHLKKIRRETTYVARMIERLLDLSRWEKSQPLLYTETFLLTDALLETAENLEEAAIEKNVLLNLDFPEKACWVKADRHRTRDLFQILLENVIEHAGSGVQVEVSVESREGRHWVSVVDDGVGLPDHFRSGWNGQAQVCATGRASLGLAIAYRLAKAHEGRLILGAGPDGVGTKAAFSFVAVEPETQERPSVPEAHSVRNL